MISLSKLLIEAQRVQPIQKPTIQPTETPQAAPVSQGRFYDWTRDFDVFRNTINAAQESAQNKLKKTLSSKILNKSVLVKASKAQPHQPVKDYTIKRVTNVSIVKYDDKTWTVVLKDEFNKEFCLVDGYKIKVIGVSVAAEPGESNAPKPEPAPLKQATRPTTTTNPTKPIAEPNATPAPQLEENVSPYYETLNQTLKGIEEYIIQNGIQLDPSEHPSNDSDPFGISEPFLFDGISYGQTKDAHYKLASYKGKRTKKYLHVSIYRMTDGRYELTQYIS